MPTQNHLQTGWVIWDQLNIKDYDTSLRQVCSFDTVEEFWKYWLYIPKVSEFFTDGPNKKLVDGKGIKGFLLFRKGIAPRWEEAVNANGSILHAIHYPNLDVVDIYWENLVLGMIGEVFEDGSEICGCRVVKSGAKNNYKFEIWLRTKEDEVAAKIKSKIGDVLTDGEGFKGKSLDFDHDKKDGSNNEKKKY